MTPTERAIGWVGGISHASNTSTWRESCSARGALEQVLLRHLQNDEPVYQSFSGGIDSSLLLAVATHVARTHGTQLPIPVTNTYVDEPTADESAWQRLVLRHLDLESNWVRVPHRRENDLVGPQAMPFLRRHGVCWPNAFLVNLRDLCGVVPAGATLLTGDGGDEAMGSRRITPLTAIVRHRRVNRAALTGSARAFAPRALRRWDAHRQAQLRDGVHGTWVRPPLYEESIAHEVADEIAEPLSPRRGVEYWANRRAVRIGMHNMRCLGDEHGVELDFPLVSDEFTTALKRETGWLGWLGRADIVRRIAGDLLPEETIRRTTKAWFGTVMFNESAAQVVQLWNGRGLDERLVDVDALRAEWRQQPPDAGTAALLQEVALLVDQQ